ncbi:uncharacterized protein LOC126678234 [Mercurialis annua]|uniref:uncharacterized protein LOC126678234 n=1 Tax=Mercurialis annua TaxID=3986 RepID=UPI00215F5806|nr:uncharacterized protein LOC126678234 [Mercurialis annua]
MLLGNLKKELWTAEKRLDSIWVQKSRLKWSAEGDRNTKFFHSVASKHYRNNHISSIQVDENVFTEPNEIRSYVRNFFQSLYGQQSRVHFDLSRLIFSKISLEQAENLSLPFSINTSFMVLVPKVAGSENIKDYRPISLVNGFFKLL